MSLLHDDPLVDQLLDPCGLLELSQQIEAVLPFGFERVLMQDFARIDIVFLGRKQVLRGIFGLRIVVDVCLVDSKASVAAEDLFILMMVYLVLR